MKEYIILNCDETFLYDCEEVCRRGEKNIRASTYFVPCKNVLMRYVRKIHCSNKINQIIRLPGKEKWSVLDTIEWDENKEYCVVFMGVYSTHLEPKYLKELQRRHKISYVLVMFESLSSSHAYAAKYYLDNIEFDHVFSYDPADAEKYGFNYTYVPYEQLANDAPCETDYDLYYAGRNEPNRLKNLDIVCKAIQVHSMTAKIRIAGVPRKQMNLPEEMVIYNQFVDYNTIVRETQKCNCILEMQYPGSSGATNRYYEAVCYNKKLLTSNQGVVELPFYDPQYMKVYDSVEDIDWEWVKERVPINYHYDGRFSMRELIKRIMALEEPEVRHEVGEQ